MEILTQLKKEMIKAKRTDKARANALMMLIDTAQKLAKEQGVEPGEKEIQEAAKKLVKIAKESLEAGVPGADRELEIYKSFLPKMLGEQETLELLEKLIKEVGGKKIGEIMKRLKERGDVDLGLANRLLREL
ncbi:MAG: GatB/YqeY domain-containing protein [Campylobacterales bacterium]